MNRISPLVDIDLYETYVDALANTGTSHVGFPERTHKGAVVEQAIVQSTQKSQPRNSRIKLARAPLKAFLNALGLAVVFVMLSEGFPAKAAEPSFDLPPFREYLAPGEVDLLVKTRPNVEQYNAFVWAPGFRGGGGVVNPHGADSISHGGAYIRPLDDHPVYGNLIVGGHVVDTPLNDAGEFQVDYHLPIGLGIGGGLVRQDDGPDVNFGKLSFKGEHGNNNYLAEALLTDFGHGTRGGAYGAAYNEKWFGSAGYDGEQYRLTGAFVCPENETAFRPAMEAIWADTSIGDLPGPRVIFLNGSLGYSGGFLGNSARLGRAMGPTGVQYGNPIGFLDPSWNRRFDLWEIGRVVNFRYEWLEFPSGKTTQKFEVIAFPFQLLGRDGILDGAFIGPSYIDDSSNSGAGIVWGYSRKLGQWIASVGIDNHLATGDVLATAGVRLLY